MLAIILRIFLKLQKCRASIAIFYIVLWSVEKTCRLIEKSTDVFILIYSENGFCRLCRLFNLFLIILPIIRLFDSNERAVLFLVSRSAPHLRDLGEWHTNFIFIFKKSREWHTKNTSQSKFHENTQKNTKKTTPKSKCSKNLQI